MPFIEADFKTDYEDKPVAEGLYDLRIISAKDKVSKAGNQMTECMIAIEGTDGAAPIFHYLVWPNKKTEADKARLFMRNNTRFLKLFGVPIEDGGFNTEDLAGATADQVPIGLEESDMGTQNRLKLPAVYD